MALPPAHSLLLSCAPTASRARAAKHPSAHSPTRPLCGSCVPSAHAFTISHTFTHALTHSRADTHTVACELAHLLSFPSPSLRLFFQSRVRSRLISLSHAHYLALSRSTERAFIVPYFSAPSHSHHRAFRYSLIHTAALSCFPFVVPDYILTNARSLVTSYFRAAGNSQTVTLVLSQLSRRILTRVPSLLYTLFHDHLRSC